MCGFGKMNNSKKKFLSFERFKILYDSLKDKTESVRINGRGESTIHPDFENIVEYIGKNKEIILFTNGNYVNSKINDLFNTYKFQLYFSIDSIIDNKLESIRKGCDAKRIKANIDAVSTKKERPFLIFTIQEENIDEIEDIADFALLKNCHLIYNVVRRDKGIEPFVDLVNEKRCVLIETFKQVIDKFDSSTLNCYVPDQIAGIVMFDNESLTCGTSSTCPNLESELCIFYNGDVTPCNMFNPYVYGNIADNSIEEILDGEKYAWFKENHKSYYYCSNCACLKR